MKDPTVRSDPSDLADFPAATRVRIQPAAGWRRAGGWRTRAGAIAFGFCLLAPLQAVAQPRIVDQDLAMLPEYCRANRLVNHAYDPAQAQIWSKRLHPMWAHIHHYCWALVANNRATFFSKNRIERNKALETSIPDIDYVLRYASRDFVLLPELLFKKGETFLRIGQPNRGIPILESAIDVRPDYWPPYAAIADYYTEIGDISKARELLERGLAASPDTKALKSRLAALEGKKNTRQSPPAREPAKPSAAAPKADKAPGPEDRANEKAEPGATR